MATVIERAKLWENKPRKKVIITKKEYNIYHKKIKEINNRIEEKKKQFLIKKYWIPYIDILHDKVYQKRIYIEHQKQLEIDRLIQLKLEEVADKRYKLEINSVAKIQKWFRSYKNLQKWDYLVSYIMKMQKAKKVSSLISNFYKTKFEQLVLERNQKLIPIKHNIMARIIQRWYRNTQLKRKSLLIHMGIADNKCPFLKCPLYQIPFARIIIYDIGNVKSGCDMIQNLKWIANFDFMKKPTNVFTGKEFTEVEFNETIVKAESYRQYLIKTKTKYLKTDSDNKKMIDEYNYKYKENINHIDNELKLINKLITDIQEINYYRKFPSKMVEKLEIKLMENTKSVRQLINRHLEIKEQLQNRLIPLDKSDTLLQMYQPTFLEKLESKVAKCERMKEYLEEIKLKCGLIQPKISTSHNTNITPSAPPSFEYSKKQLKSAYPSLDSMLE